MGIKIDLILQPLQTYETKWLQLWQWNKLFNMGLWFSKMYLSILVSFHIVSLREKVFSSSMLFLSFCGGKHCSHCNTKAWKCYNFIFLQKQWLYFPFMGQILPLAWDYLFSSLCPLHLVHFISTHQLTPAIFNNSSTIPLWICLSFLSHYSASQALPSCRVTTAVAASSASKAVPRTWAPRTSSPTTSTAQLRRAKTDEAPCLSLTAATATVATAKARHASTPWHPTLEGRGTAQWTAMAWCLSSALGPADGFCLRWK